MTTADSTIQQTEVSPPSTQRAIPAWVGDVRDIPRLFAIHIGLILARVLLLLLTTAGLFAGLFLGEALFRRNDQAQWLCAAAGGCLVGAPSYLAFRWAWGKLQSARPK